jgi:hypothetical protein
VAPADIKRPDSGGLGNDRLQGIISRLKEVRRKCADSPVLAGRQNVAVEGLAAVLADLETCMGNDAEPMQAGDLDLRLATIEERFEATGSHGVGQVIASIRTSLAVQSEEPRPDEEPPPPQRFQPSPGSAVRRRRPRPNSRKNPTKTTATTPKGGFKWLRLMVLIVGTTAVAAFVYLKWFAPETPSPAPPNSAAIERPVFSTRSISIAPENAPTQSGSNEDFDPHEEDMARFTFEISLAELSLEDGNLNESLKHFAAAASIDRHHQRVVSMGKSLIAAMLHDADLAYDNGNRELAGKKVQSARSIARGLQLVGSSVANTNQQDASTVYFVEITPRDGEALGRAVGQKVRLTLKTRDVVYGYLIEIEDHILYLDIYAGIMGQSVDSAAPIPASTIKDLRVYNNQ